MSNKVSAKHNAIIIIIMTVQIWLAKTLNNHLCKPYIQCG